MRLRRQPMPPSNIQIAYKDGTVVPVECVYEGKEGAQHVWTMVLPEALRSDVMDALAQITVGVLPARTTVRFPIEDDPPTR